MKLPMVLVAFGPALFLGFLVSFAQALVNLFDDEANIEPSHRLSGLGPRDLPPNYGPPTYDYGSPPPYGYETPALTTTVTVSSDYSTFTTSVTSKKTKLVTVTNQPHLTSGEYTTLTNTLTVTKSGGAGSESASVSTKSDSWVKSSALGVTGTSTASRSTEWESSSSAETEATSSEMVTGPRSSLGHASTATITFTFVTSESSTLASIDKGTSTKPNTASVPQQTTRTDSVISSRSSFETSSLPSTANVSSNDGDSTASATSNSVATITWIVTSTRNGDANASSSTSSWSSLSEETASPSKPLVTSTITISSERIVTTILESISSGRTRAEETDTRSYTVNSSTIASSATSTTEIDGTPRTQTYFSSTWTNSTTSSYTAVLPSTVTHASSLSESTSSRLNSVSIATRTGITTTAVSLSSTATHQIQTSLFSSGASRGTSSQSFSSLPFPVSSNRTISQSIPSGSPWVSSSALGTVTPPVSSQDSIKTSKQASASTRTTIATKSTTPPFSNSTTTSTNISHHGPWTISAGQTITLTSIVWNSLPSHPSKHNSTDGNSSPTSSPRITTSRARFTYRPSSVILSTDPGSGVITGTLPPFPMPSNTTSHQSTTQGIPIISSFLSSSGHASSSESHESSFTNVVNATSHMTLTRELTSTNRMSFNSSRTLSQSAQPSDILITTVRGSGGPKTSVFKSTSTQLSTLTISMGTSLGHSGSASTPRWTNSTTKPPASTGIGTTKDSSLKQITITTWSTVLSLSRTRGMNLTTNAPTDSKIISDQPGTVVPSEVTLWPTNISSSIGAESPQPGVPSITNSTVLFPNSTKTVSVSTAKYTKHTSVEVTTVTLVPICIDTVVNGLSSLFINTVPTTCATLVNGTTTMTRCPGPPNANDPGVTSLSKMMSNPEPAPTTFSTSVRDSETSTESGPGSGRGSSRHPQSTNRLGSKPEASLPNNPNFPWGSDSPIHRHQSVAQLGAGMVEGGIWRRWAKKTIQKLKAYLA